MHGFADICFVDTHDICICHAASVITTNALCIQVSRLSSSIMHDVQLECCSTQAEGKQKQYDDDTIIITQMMHFMT